MPKNAWFESDHMNIESISDISATDELYGLVFNLSTLNEIHPGGKSREEKINKLIKTAKTLIDTY